MILTKDLSWCLIGFLLKILGYSQNTTIIVLIMHFVDFILHFNDTFLCLNRQINK